METQTVVCLEGFRLADWCWAFSATGEMMSILAHSVFYFEEQV